MNIPDKCDICNSKVIEGDYGQAWWICTNKACSKSNPDWSFKATFQLYEDEFKKLEYTINELKNISVSDYYGTIELQTARWMGDGSGKIHINNRNIKFYFDGSKTILYGPDEQLISLLKLNGIENRLRTLWDLAMKQLSIFDK